MEGKNNPLLSDEEVDVNNLLSDEEVEVSPKQPTSSQGAESGFQGNAPLAKPNGLSDFTGKPISTPTSPSVSTSSVGEKNNPYSVTIKNAEDKTRLNDMNTKSPKEYAKVVVGFNDLITDTDKKIGYQAEKIKALNNEWDAKFNRVNIPSLHPELAAEKNRLYNERVKANQEYNKLIASRDAFERNKAKVQGIITEQERKNVQEKIDNPFIQNFFDSLHNGTGEAIEGMKNMGLDDLIPAWLNPNVTNPTNFKKQAEEYSKDKKQLIQALEEKAVIDESKVQAENEKRKELGQAPIRSYVGQTFGGLTPALLIAAGATATGTEGALPAMNASWFGTMGYGASLAQGYNEARKLGYDKEESYQLAKNSARVGGTVQGLLGIYMGQTGEALSGLNPYNKAITGDISKNAIKQAVTDFALKSVGTGAEFSGARVGENIGQKYLNPDVYKSKDVLEGGAESFGEGLLLHTTMSAFHAPKEIIGKASLINAVSEARTPEDVSDILSTIQKAKDSKFITEGMATQLSEKVGRVREAINLVPDSFTDKDVREKATDLILRHQDVAEKLKKTPEGLKPFVEDELKAINSQFESLRQEQLEKQKVAKEESESKANMEQQVEAATTEESKGVGEDTQAFTTDEKGKNEPIENVEDKIAVGGLKEGYTTSTETRLNADKNSAQYKENFDPRTSEGENSGNSFISTIERNGKKYRIVGLRMSNPKTIINGKPDRSGMSYASIVDDGNLPSNIDDLLIKKAIGEGKKLYSDVVELEDSDFIMPSEYKPTPIEESPVDLEKNKTSEKTENKEAVVPVKLFKQGDGGTRGVFEDKDGKLYKSIEPQEIVMTNNGIIRQPIKDVVTDEHKILSDLQNNPHIPKIGKIVNTSEGRAFEIEKLDEVDNFTKNEYRQIQKILNDLNDKGYHVGDRVTVMKRPKTGELVIVDFSAGYKGSRMSRDAEDYMQNVFDKLSKSDAIHIKQEDLAAHNRYMAENLMKKESTTEYYLTQRPPSIGTHPTEGLKSIEETEYRGRKVWKLTYDKKLSADQIYKFELTPKITNKEYLGQKISGIYGENLFYITDIDYKQGKVTLVSELNGKEISKDLSFKEFQKGIDDGKYKVQKSNEEAVVPSKEGSMGEATSEGEQPQAEVVEPTEGSRVELPNDFKNGLPKKMVFSQGEWKQEIGNELGKVGKKQQEEANNKFNQLNTKENATKEVSEQASVQGERKEGDASGETTKASGSNSVQREETSKQKEVKPKTTKKDVKISPRQKRINTLVDRINYYNNVLGKGKGNGYKKGRETVEGRELLNEINGIVRELGLHLDIQTNGIVVKYKKGGSKIRATYGGNKVGVENHVGLEQRRKSTQELFHTLNNAGQISFPIIRGLDGRKFTPKQIAEAISDVVNGHNSILADSLLNTLDRAIEEDFFETESYGREGNFIPLRDVMKYFGSQEGGMDYFTEDIDSEQEIKLAEEYDEWFNGLSEQEKEQELKYLQDEGTTDTETESESDVANQASKRVKETTSETSRKEKIAEAKKDFDAKQRAYEKAKVELEKRGMQDQVDIFGATKGEEMLFKNDLSEQRKIVDGLKKEAEKAKDVLSKLESEQEVGENQLTIEEPTKAEVSKENTEVQSNKESAQWDKDVESTAKALEGVGNGTVENSSELNSLIDKIESNIPYTIRKTFNKDSELISISDNTGTYSPKSKRGKELMGMIIDRLTGNSPKKMLYRGISSGEAYSEFHLRDKTRSQYISEAYHKAKADGNNPELVKAVEDLLGSTQSGIKAERKVESAPEKVQKEVKVDLKKIQEVADDMYALRKEPLTAKEKSEVKAKIAEQPLEVRESIAKAKKLMDKLEKQGLIRTIECK